MIHSKSLKLAALYLSIIMFISLFFSVAVYQLSTQELDRGIREPYPAFEIEPGRDLPLQTRKALRQEAAQRSEDAKENVRDRLIITNIMILISAGFLSYYLASRTLRPIEQAHEAQSRFTADASHELRTPIAAMRSEIEVALMDPELTLNQTKKLLKSNLEELDKLTALSSGLLKLAQNEYGTLEMNEVDLDKVLSDAIARVSNQATQKSITINYQLAKKITVRANATSLTDLFAILIDNAIKYSPEKSAVLISTGIHRRHATVSVKDEGIGMLANDKLHIFDRFYRADSARNKQKNNGYGIGLSIAKQIAEVHKATIKVNSEPGKGSTFSVSLALV